MSRSPQPLLASTSAGLVLATALALAGCGGTGSSTGALIPVATPAPTAAPTASLHGTVAVGSPVAGATVVVKCASGATASATTDSAGNYTVTIPAAAPPCILEASGGTVAGTAYANKLHSIAVAAGILNVTPLTDLAVAAFAKTSASAYFAGAFDVAAWARITAQALQTAEALVIANLRALALSVPSIDFFTGVFQPIAGDAYDALLAALAAEAAAIQDLLAQSVIAGIVGTYPSAPASPLLVASMAGTWDTADTKVNRISGTAITGAAVNDHCRIDVTSAGLITVTTGRQTWTAQVPPAHTTGNTNLDSQYAPYHYTGYAVGTNGVTIGWGYFGQSPTVFSNATPMSTTVQINGVDSLFCANYRYS